MAEAEIGIFISFLDYHHLAHFTHSSPKSLDLLTENIYQQMIEL